jgi:hypothetical protein
LGVGVVVGGEVKTGAGAGSPVVTDEIGDVVEELKDPSGEPWQLLTKASSPQTKPIPGLKKRTPIQRLPGLIRKHSVVY